MTFLSSLNIITTIFLIVVFAVSSSPCGIATAMMSSSSSSITEEASPSYFTILSGLDSVIDGDNVSVTRYITSSSSSSSTTSQQQKQPNQNLLQSISHAHPFLIFDWYNLSSNSNSRNSDHYYSFPAHIHQGFLEIRYIVQGHVEHEDICGSGNDRSNNNKAILEQGGFHVLNAVPGGIAHEERFYPSSSPAPSSSSSSSSMFQGFQLWFDVPPSKRLTHQHHEHLQKSFHKPIGPQEIPQTTAYYYDFVQENEESDDSSSTNMNVDMKCLGYYNMNGVNQNSIFSSQLCKHSPIRKINKKQKNKKKNRNHHHLNNQILDFSPFFDYFLMIELSPSSSTTSSQSKFRYSITDEFKTTTTTATTTNIGTITCLSYFYLLGGGDGGSTNAKNSSFVKVNGEIIHEGELKVEVLKRKDFVVESDNDDEIFSEFEFYSNNNNNMKLLHVCASNDNQNNKSNKPASIFHSQGIVFHSRSDLDDALLKLKNGTFELNC